MASDNKKPIADFFIRVVGSNIRPWNMPLRVLTRVLDATQRLVDPPSDDVALASGEDEENDRPILDKPSLRLLDIKQGSAGYAVSGPDAVARLISAGKAISNPAEADWAGSEVGSLEQLSAIARSLDAVIEYRIGSLKGEIIARITAKTTSEIEGTAFVSGETSVVGSIERVGGATKLHCGLRIPDQSRMLICQVSSAEIARQLGQYLYQTVVVSGRARWLRKNWHIKRFRISSFDSPKTGSSLKALEAASRAGGRVWDTIDNPEQYVAGLRG